MIFIHHYLSVSYSCVPLLFAITTDRYQHPDLVYSGYLQVLYSLTGYNPLSYDMPIIPWQYPSHLSYDIPIIPASIQVTYPMTYPSSLPVFKSLIPWHTHHPCQYSSHLSHDIPIIPWQYLSQLSHDIPIIPASIQVTYHMTYLLFPDSIQVTYPMTYLSSLPVFKSLIPWHTHHPCQYSSHLSHDIPFIPWQYSSHISHDIHVSYSLTIYRFLIPWHITATIFPDNMHAPYPISYNRYIFPNNILVPFPMTCHMTLIV